MLSTEIQIDGVHSSIARPGIGRVYSLILTADELSAALEGGTLQFAGRYGAGGEQPRRIHDRQLRVPVEPAARKAAQLLTGPALLDSIILNLRCAQPPHFDRTAGRLRAQDASVVIAARPERALALHFLSRWHRYPEEIPASIDTGEREVRAQELSQSAAQGADGEYMALLYVLDAARERALAEEMDANWRGSSAPPGSNAIESRFVQELQRATAVLSAREVESGSTIGSKSRKLTSLPTLLAAFAAQRTTLREAERQGTSARRDLVEFIAAAFDTWADIFPQWAPSSSAAQRQDLRTRSLALSNTFVHALVRLAIEWWQELRERPERTELLAARLRACAPLLERSHPRWKGTVLRERKNHVNVVANDRVARTALYETMRDAAARPAPA